MHTCFLMVIVCIEGISYVQEQRPNTMAVFETTQGTFRVVGSYGDFSKDPLGFGKGDRQHFTIQSPHLGSWIEVEDFKCLYESKECVFVIGESTVHVYMAEGFFGITRESLYESHTLPRDLAFTGKVVENEFLELKQRNSSSFAGLFWYDWGMHKYVYATYPSKRAAGCIAVYRVKKDEKRIILYLRNGEDEFQQIEFDTNQRKFLCGANR